MKLLVIGKKGQVARALGELAGEKSSVLCVGRPQVDVTKPDSVVAVLDEFNPDLVINASAYTAVDKAETDEEMAFSVNCDAVRMLGRISADRQLPIIHLSTDYVFDGEKKGAYREDDILNPINVYGRSKLAGELALAEENPHHVILRTSWVFSAVGTNFLKTMLQLARTKTNLDVVGDQFGRPTYAPDIAKSIFEIARQLANKDGDVKSFGVFHVAGKGKTNWSNFAREIFRQSKAMGGPSAAVDDFEASHWTRPAKRPSNCVLDCKRIKETYGIVLPTWQNAVERCLSALELSSASQFENV